MMNESPSIVLALKASLASFARLSIFANVRQIAIGDEDGLLCQEAASFRTVSTKRRRQGGAARIIAHELLGHLNCNNCAILKSFSGAPIWPAGIVGSLAHDDCFAAAVVAHSINYRSLGIDIEPAEPLPEGLVEIVSTRNELANYSPEILTSRKLFVVKEAVYKAVYPIDSLFLDFCDIEVDVEEGLATIVNGRTVAFHIVDGAYLLAIAYIKE